MYVWDECVYVCERDRESEVARKDMFVTCFNLLKINTCQEYGEKHVICGLHSLSPSV